MTIKNSVILTVEKTDFLEGVQQQFKENPELWKNAKSIQLNKYAFNQYLVNDINAVLNNF